MLLSLGFLGITLSDVLAIGIHFNFVLERCDRERLAGHSAGNRLLRLE